LEALGGVKIVYHKNIQKSSAYATNHEELQEALEKGVKFIENFELEDIIFDDNNFVVGIKSIDGEIINAKSLFIACGSNINVNLLRKIGISEEKIAKFIYKLTNKSIKDAESTLIDEKISVIGDMNPQYSGSVVKAILSGKVASKEITQLLVV
jgi:L-2-hydroxyglutarate oxidase LhgO